MAEFDDNDDPVPDPDPSSDESSHGAPDKSDERLRDHSSTDGAANSLDIEGGAKHAQSSETGASDLAALQAEVRRLAERLAVLEHMAGARPEATSDFARASEGAATDVAGGAFAGDSPFQSPPSSPTANEPPQVIFDDEQLVTAEIVPSDEGQSTPPWTDPAGPQQTESGAHSSGPFAGAAFSDGSLESVVGGRWMTWLGAFTMIVAFGFFIPWAWTHFDFPPWLRVLIFHLIACAFLAGAWVANRRSATLVLSQGLAGIGFFGLYASAWAAQHNYGVWGESGDFVTFMECALITAGTILLAMRWRSPGIVLLGALGGYLTPVIASRGSGDYVVLFVYLAFLNVSLIACAVIRGWSFLKPIALAATVLMFAEWILQDSFNGKVVWGTQWLLMLHWAIFLAGATLPPLLWRRKTNSLDLMGLVGAALWFMTATWFIFHDREGQQLALVAWSLSALHAVLFGVTFRAVTLQDRMPRAHLALAALFVTLAAPMQIEESLQYLAVTWSTQALIFTSIGVYFRDRQMCVSALLVTILVGIRLCVDLISDPVMIGASPIDQRAAMFFLSGAITMLAGLSYFVIGKAIRADENPRFGADYGAVLLGCGNVAAMIAFPLQWDGRLVLLLWTLNAAAAWAIGFKVGRSEVRWFAACFAFCFVGGRAAFHANQVSNYTPLANDRFLSLATVAAVLFAAGWFYRHLKTNEKLGPLDHESIMDVVMGIAANAVLVIAISFEIGSWYDAVEVARGAPPHWDMARMATYSIVWSLYAAGVVVSGFALKYQLFRMIGLAAFLPIAAKVFFVDMSSLELLPRVMALAVLGMMLLGVSFLYQKFAAQLLEPQQDEEVHVEDGR